MIDGVVDTPPEQARRYFEKRLWIDLTVGEALRRTAARVPDRIAFASEEGELTFRELDERSDRLGGALLAMGVQPGERAVFQMGTVLETVVALSACYKAGIIPVCSVPQYREIEIGQLARLSGASLYFVQADFSAFDLVGFARGMQEKVPSLERLVVARGKNDELKRLIDSVSLGEARTRLSRVKQSPEDCFVFQLSGGSTGVPKIIPRFHAEYLAHCDAWNKMQGMDEHSVAIWSLPIVHNAGQIFGYMGAIHWGRTTVLTSRVDIAHILGMIEKYRVTNAMSIGPIAPLLLAYKDLAKHDLSSLRYFVAFSRADAIEAHLKVKAANLYGITEGLVLISHPDDPLEARHRTQGRVGYTGEEIRILKPGAEEAKEGEVGELCFRGPSSLRGYYNAPAQTRETLTADGFVRTGDLAKAHRIEGHVYFSFEGRLKDNINRGGEKFGTEEVENLIRNHPAVADVAVVAMPDELLIERACAFLVPRSGMQAPDVKALGVFLSSLGLAKFKFPERIELVDAFPVTRVGKLDKAELRRRIAEKAAQEKKSAA
jgi:pyochelin biosynthesis protein PchD